MNSLTKSTLAKFATFGFVVAMAYTFWPSTWWPNTQPKGAPTMPAKSKELSWNGYDPLVLVSDVVPGEWVSIQLEQQSSWKRIQLTVGKSQKGKTLKVRIFGPDFSLNDSKIERQRPFQHDDEGRELKSFTPVVILTRNPKTWWSAPLSVVSWGQAEEFDSKKVCHNIYKEPLTCLIVLNAKKGYRSDKVFYKGSMTFLVTEHVPVSP